MSTFDIEAAKRGEPVEFRSSATNTWEPCHFIGASKESHPVVQLGESIFEVKSNYLRMASKKIKVRYRVAAMRDSDGSAYTLSANTEGQVSNVQGLSNFIEWLTDWQEAEVEQ